MPPAIAAAAVLDKLIGWQPDQLERLMIGAPALPRAADAATLIYDMSSIVRERQTVDRMCSGIYRPENMQCLQRAL